MKLHLWENHFYGFYHNYQRENRSYANFYQYIKEKKKDVCLTLFLWRIDLISSSGHWLYYIWFVHCDCVCVFMMLFVVYWERRRIFFSRSLLFPFRHIGTPVVPFIPSEFLPRSLLIQEVKILRSRVFSSSSSSLSLVCIDSFLIIQLTVSFPSFSLSSLLRSFRIFVDSLNSTDCAMKRERESTIVKIKNPSFSSSNSTVIFFFLNISRIIYLFQFFFHSDQTSSRFQCILWQQFSSVLLLSIPS